jgi:peptidoglycan/LPS O-acetylase OafA/YrhL
MRGLAAIVVLLDHVLACYPNFSSGQNASPAYAVVSHTPLHLVWDGAAAVILFFLLSGFALNLWTETGNFTWVAYYPSRLLRLYLPVAGACLLGWAIIQIRPPTGPLDSTWATRNSTYTFWAALQDSTLIHLSGQIGPLWSLQWEVIFSLALPAFVLLIKKCSPVAVACFSAIAIAFGIVADVPHLIYVPIFLLGMVLKVPGQRFRILLLRANAAKYGCIVLSILILELPWMLDGTCSGKVEVALCTFSRIIGSIGLIISVGFVSSFSKPLTSRPAQWFGKISFSLYLVHEPIAIAFYRLFQGHILAIVFIPVLCLCFAAVFCKFVESPAHRLSRQTYQILAHRDPGPSAI